MSVSAMAKKKGRPRSNRKEKVVRIEAGIAAKIQRVADHLGLTFSEAHTVLAEPAVNRAYAKMIRELDATGGNDQ